jgi:hypothetical protein
MNYPHQKTHEVKLGKKHGNGGWNYIHHVFFSYLSSMDIFGKKTYTGRYDL